MTLADLAAKVGAWHRRTFANATDADIIAKMREEVSELEAAPDDIEEAADVLLVLLAYCDRRGWSERLLTVAVCKYGVNLHRDFTGQPGATEAR